MLHRSLFLVNIDSAVGFGPGRRHSDSKRRMHSEHALKRAVKPVSESPSPALACHNLRVRPTPLSRAGKEENFQ